MEGIGSGLLMNFLDDSVPRFVHEPVGLERLDLLGGVDAVRIDTTDPQGALTAIFQ